MNKLLTYLTNQLTQFTENVGFRRVSEDTYFPYVTYKYTSSNPLTEGDIEDVIFEIDIWHQDIEGIDAVTEIEVLTRNIENHLKKNRHCGEGVFYLFQLIGKLNIEDEDFTLHRRQLRFRVRHYY